MPRTAPGVSVLSSIARVALLLLALGGADGSRLGCGMGEIAGIDDRDGDGAGDGIDCWPDDPTQYPGAGDWCDGLDNDCDELVDEGFDEDEDGYLDAERCPGLGQDCDDSNPTVYPGASEVCDGVDEDCDGVVDDDPIDGYPGWTDADGDGWGDSGRPGSFCTDHSGWSNQEGDCDDSDPTVFPWASESCNGVDDDCDEEVDEDPVGELPTWYPDADGDGWGWDALGIEVCSRPSNYVSLSGDCDESDPAIHPGAEEHCDDVDNDCDGVRDNDPVDGLEAWEDFDKDGWGGNPAKELRCPDANFTAWVEGDCDDHNGDAYPGAEEFCDEADNDCDGTVDEPEDIIDLPTWLPDADGDGYGDDSLAIRSCTAPSGWVFDAYGGDCDDTDPEVYPGAYEIQGMGDTNCDGVESEEAAASCLELLQRGLSLGDGLYEIDPDGASGAMPPQTTFCDMTTSGGGWTLVQRTVWDWGETSQLLSDYATWYGSTIGDPEPGYAYRMEGQAWGVLDQWHDSMMVMYPRDSSTGNDCAPLYYEDSYVKLSVTATDATLTYWESPTEIFAYGELSATDVGPYTGCTASPYYGVPWFYGKCCLTCPSHQGGHWSDEPHPMAQYLDTDPDSYGLTDADVCSSGGAEHSGGGSWSFEGVNVMEYYLR